MFNNRGQLSCMLAVLINEQNCRRMGHEPEETYI